jgi:hypothetical protein
VDNPEKTVGANKGGQSRENHRPCVPIRFSLGCPFFCAHTVFSGLSALVFPYGFIWVIRSFVPLNTRAGNPEKTVGAHKKGQPRENRRGTQGWTNQKKTLGHIRKDNPEKTVGFLCAPMVFSGLSTLVCPYSFLRGNRRGTQERTTQRKP